MKLSTAHALVAVALLLRPEAVQASILTPPVLPLAVRTPYLSTWLPNAREPPWHGWPMFYTGEALGLSIMVRTNKTVYPLLGRPQDSLTSNSSSFTVKYAAYRGAQFDSASTNLSYAITEQNDSTTVTVSFLSPITPTSTLRQAIPASYLHISMTGSLAIAVYVDANGQWVSGSRDAIIQWDMYNSSARTPTKSWAVTRRDEQVFVEYNDRAEWGSFWLTAPADVDHESGTSASIRSRFAYNGSLANATDKTYRGIMHHEPIFAFSKRFSRPTSSSATWSNSILFTIAHLQDPVVHFAASTGLSKMLPLWSSYFDTRQDLISYHYHDFGDAGQLSQSYSAQVHEEALAYGGPSYSDIVALSARQVMGATVFSGSPTHPLLFLKEISSNGNSQTVDIIFPAMPFFLYTNPSWLVYLLEPLLDHQLSGQYPNNYSMHDLGTHFPNMTGYSEKGDDEYMPVEECGDMLIIALALSQALRVDTSSADGIMSASGIYQLMLADTRGTATEIEPSVQSAKSWVLRSWRLWQQWTGYLIKYSLEPQNQLCTDDFAGELALQSNLALKGIIGIKAMSELALLLDHMDDYHYYRNISDTYVRIWKTRAISRDGERVKLAYDWQGSWTTLYSLYANALLCFHLAKQEPRTSAEVLQVPLTQQTSMFENDFLPYQLYTKQSQWYLTAMQKYGLPLDSRHLYAKSDWQIQAASVALPETRREIVERIALWLNETHTDRPFSDLYITEGEGGFPGPNFFARPVVGSHFAPLVLGKACDGHGADPFQGE